MPLTQIVCIKLRYRTDNSLVSLDRRACSNNQNTLQEFTESYAALPYDREQLHEIQCDQSLLTIP